MGKQIQIFTTDKDNLIFEKFLRDNFDCILYQSFAPSIKDLVLKNINDTYYAYNKIYIYNRDFKWTPRYKQAKNERKDYYISNTLGVPIIEFSKSNFQQNQNGRLYWQKEFAKDFLNYNAEEFNRFYNQIANWFKQNKKGKEKFSNINVYYLKDAWRKKCDIV